MSHYYTDIKAGIITYLQTSTKVRNIYDYEETQPAGYPAINVTPFAGEAEFLDTLRTRRSFQFTIRVLQERLEIGPSGAESVITTLVDELIAIFEAAGSSSLVNTVIFTQPPSTKWGYLQVPDADVRTCDITLIGIAAQ